jgi:hypothetical protein
MLSLWSGYYSSLYSKNPELITRYENVDSE